jgi:lipoprotein-releasing system permease protein
MAGIATTTAALIIVLSVFNGLEGLLRSLFTSFDPEIKIELVRGKSFPATDSLLSKIRAVPGVKIVTEVIEDYAIVRYNDANTIVTMKGMSDNFIDQHRLDDHLDEGKAALKDKGVSYAIVGRGVKYALSLSMENEFDQIQVIYIKSLKSAGSLDPSKLYSQRSINAGAVFSIEKSYDENYIFLPLDFVQELAGYGNKRTSLEVMTSPDSKTNEVAAQLKKILGGSFAVLTNEEQHKDLYRLLKIEKIFGFLAFSLLISIGSINIFFSLMMLAIEKKKDISVLSALGGNQSLIRRIFMSEGALISVVGAVTGLVLGGVVVWLQDRFGLVGMGMENSVVPDYPVQLKVLDFVLTGGVTLIVAVLVSIYPAVTASKFTSTHEL